MNEQSLRPIRHPILTAADSSPHLAELINRVVPDYRTYREVVEHARTRGKVLAQEAREQPAWPVDPDPKTLDEWVANEVDRRRGVSEHSATLEVLRILEVEATDRAFSILAEKADALINALADELRELFVRVTEQVEQMSPDVSTAADAVYADCAEQWRTIHDLRHRYDSIRAVQRKLYSLVEFDGARCGDNTAGADAEARLYYFRRLAEVAPKWQGWIDEQNRHHPPEVPWPADPTEKLVWIVRKDAAPWCPTAAQIGNLLRKVPSEVPGAAHTSRPSPAGMEKRSGRDDSGHQFVQPPDMTAAPLWSSARLGGDKPHMARGR